MMKRNLLIILLAVLITLAFPFMAVTFKGGDEGAAMSAILYFLVSPMALLLIGIVSGQNMKSCWFQPLLFSVLYTFGLRTFLKMGPNDFMNHGIKYLILGYIVALLSAWFTHRRRKAAEKEAQKKK